MAARLCLLSLVAALASCTAAPSGAPRKALPTHAGPRRSPEASTPLRLPGPCDDAGPCRGSFSAASPRRAEEAATLNASCEGCHADIAAEWRASQHRVAFTEPFFQRALAIEPMPFCRGCHAPEADPRVSPPPSLAELGVGCITCHVTSRGSVFAAPATTGAAVAACSLPIERDARFATAEACASCHEF